jgi:hypothetical protein
MRRFFETIGTVIVSLTVALALVSILAAGVKASDPTVHPETSLVLTDDAGDNYVLLGTSAGVTTDADGIKTAKKVSIVVHAPTLDGELNITPLYYQENTSGLSMFVPLYPTDTITLTPLNAPRNEFIFDVEGKGDKIEFLLNKTGGGTIPIQIISQPR